MRSFVSYLVVASLALHTLLGCCVHHAHADAVCTTCEHREHDDHDCADHRHDTDEDDHLATNEPCSAEEHSGDEALAAAHQRDDHDAPCSGRCGEKCQYVTTGRVQLEKPALSLDLALTPCDVVDLAADLPSLRSEAWLTAPPPLPLRLHLWNGLLLI